MNALKRFGDVCERLAAATAAFLGVIAGVVLVIAGAVFSPGFFCVSGLIVTPAYYASQSYKRPGETSEQTTLRKIHRSDNSFTVFGLTTLNLAVLGYFSFKLSKELSLFAFRRFSSNVTTPDQLPAGKPKPRS